jgi:hypothetical protein
MTEHERGIAKVVGILMLLITLNFIAVITGMADSYYDHITEWLKPWLLAKPMP